MAELCMCVCVFRGDTPSDVELMYLENAQMLALYGMHMHPAKVTSMFTMMIYRVAQLK